MRLSLTIKNNLIPRFTKYFPDILDEIHQFNNGYFASILSLFLLFSTHTNVNVLPLSPWEICSHFYEAEESGFRNYNSDVIFVSNSFSCSVSTQSVLSLFSWVTGRESNFLH